MKIYIVLKYFFYLIKKAKFEKKKISFLFEQFISFYHHSLFFMIIFSKLLRI